MKFLCVFAALLLLASLIGPGLLNGKPGHFNPVQNVWFLVTTTGVR